eukprot:scaffold29044_cov257-Skeletonema_menzelii.AAC.1
MDGDRGTAVAAANNGVAASLGSSVSVVVDVHNDLSGPSDNVNENCDLRYDQRSSHLCIFANVVMTSHELNVSYAHTFQICVTTTNSKIHQSSVPMKAQGQGMKECIMHT